MLLKIAVLVFSAVFLASLGIFLILRKKYSREARQIKDRISGSVQDDIVQDAFINSIMKDVQLSKIPFLNRLLNNFRFSKQLQVLIVQSGVPTNMGTLTLSMLSFGALVILLFDQIFTFHLIALLFGVIAASLPYLYLVIKKKRRIEKFENLLPEALDMITNALKAGFSFDSALKMVAKEIPDPLGFEIAITYEEQNLGVEMSEALRNLYGRVPSDDVEILITALIIHKKTGGNLTEVLYKTGSTIRERIKLKREVKTKTIHGRFSGMVLIMLPIVMAFAIYLLNPDYLKLLVEERIGNYMLGTAIIMQILGVLIIQKIVKIRL